MNADQQCERGEVESKRKRLRKGTHSCWECKRRKVRCTFASSTDSTCITCQRRGTRCIGQDVPEEECPVDDGAGSMERVEALLNKLVKNIDHRTTEDRPRRQSVQTQESHGRMNSSRAASRPPPAPSVSSRESPAGGILQGSRDWNAFLTAPSDCTPEFQASPISWTSVSKASGQDKISQALFASFPSQNEINTLMKANPGFSQICPRIKSGFFHRSTGEIAGAAKELGPQTHPVLLAKHMLMVAALLMGFPRHQQAPGVLEHHHSVMLKLADAAISLVTTNDEFSSSLESLECILLEGQHHSNCGNIRRAWLAHRRALMVAQLLALDRVNGPAPRRLDPETKTNRASLWTHVLYVDRFVSLMLGLPPGNTDITSNPEVHAAPANEKPREGLESFHAVVSVKIFERNQLRPSQQVMAQTLEIDRELRKTAETIPANFWRPAECSGMQTDTEDALEEALRIRDHVTHFSLLNQLHLPYLLCPSSGLNEYSRTSCIYASREILSRFITFRTLNTISACCRLADFLAVVAGITLVLAHIDGHRVAKNGNALSHQRLGDRAVVEKVLEEVEVISKPNDDMLTAKCVDVLRRLLRIEADAAEWHEERTDEAKGAGNGRDDGRDSNGIFLMTGPYCGTFKVSKRGIEFLEEGPDDAPSPDHPGQGIKLGGIGTIRVVEGTIADDHERELPTAALQMGVGRQHGYVSPPSENDQPPHALTDADNLQMTNASALPSDDFMMQNTNIYPASVTPGANEWAIPGMDGVFFDSLIMMQMDPQAANGDASSDWTRSMNAYTG
ncbi:hypothetical protein PV08_01282 [Exophiala spinifera]|uniref:Zn(2)-C6 fungal-type domain-containing protein n=1 Tax=Exophiala spinifera TaxID=91928 RepID=A0A0D2BQD9_9EURO|nr:uncharacterized protein PV08_01282 [Exophiala spinifera]KIW20705.1 hypothetical protein PV08_01282 [Exophiala spinifera]